MKITKKLSLVLKSLLSMKYGAVNTDKGELKWDGEEDLKAGDEVFITNEDGDTVAAPDGEYVTEDKKTIVVTDGKVAEIKDNEAEVAPEENEVEASSDAKEQFSAQALKMSESYDEKYRKIVAAIIAEGEDAYISEAGDDYAIKCVWDVETNETKFIRYSISWNDEGEVVVGDSVEVKPAFVPVDENVEFAEETPVEPLDEPDETEETETPEQKIARLEQGYAALLEGINKIIAAMGDIEKRVAEVEDKLAKVEAPAAEPVENENIEQSSQKRSIYSYMRRD